VTTVTLQTILDRAYRDHADRVAVVDGEESLTYRELGRQVHALARTFRRAGAEPGDRVLLLSRNRIEFVVADQAAFAGGFVRVALSPRLHPREVAVIVADCDPAVIVTEGEWMEALAGLPARAAGPRLIVDVDADRSFARLLADASAGKEALPVRTAGDPAALLYTSGTTGRPKGATLTHGNWVACIRNSMVELPPISEDDVVLTVAPLSHLGGYVAPTYYARGARHIIHRAFEPDRVLKALEEERVTAMAAVPTMLNQLVLAADDREVDASSLRAVIYAGSPIAPDRLARAVGLLGDVLVQFYGLSEAAMPLTALSAAAHRAALDGRPERLASAGRANPFVDLRLVGADGNDVSPGEMGEIVVRGDSIMAGYWKNPAATAAMIDPDGWLATGDLGMMDDDGFITIVDRRSDMIITGGYNVYPTEVENAIHTLPAVAEAAVIGLPDDTWGEAVTAFVVTRPGHTITPADVVAACRSRLAGYKTPRRVEFVAELPKTGSGKIKRRQLRESAR
jgi:long-chain acyl-CoA synthetase